MPIGLYERWAAKRLGIDETPPPETRPEQ